MFSLLTSNETRLYFIFTSNEVTYSTVFFRVKLNFSVTRINKYNAFLIQLSLASIHYLRSHFQEAIDIYKRILLDNRFVIYIFVLKEPRNCNLRIILVWSFFCSIREKAPMCIDLWKAVLLLNLVFGYYRIPKREGGRGLERLLLTSAIFVVNKQWK